MAAPWYIDWTSIEKLKGIKSDSARNNIMHGLSVLYKTGFDLKINPDYLETLTDIYKRCGVDEKYWNYQAGINGVAINFPAHFVITKNIADAAKTDIQHKRIEISATQPRNENVTIFSEDARDFSYYFRTTRTCVISRQSLFQQYVKR